MGTKPNERHPYLARSRTWLAARLARRPRLLAAAASGTPRKFAKTCRRCSIGWAQSRGPPRPPRPLTSATGSRRSRIKACWGRAPANAAFGLIEYYERRAFGKHLDVSRLFLYKATRNLMGETGDTGAFLRTTMKAMCIFGVPPEEYTPYNISRFDEEPAAFAYAFAQAYKAVQYSRLDPPAKARDELLTQVKTNLAAKLPVIFGFSVDSSYSDGARPGEIPYPSPKDRQVGGRAVAAAGYDSAREVSGPGGATTSGALLICNSLGTDWGEGGCGWLPFEYVTRGLAIDWWSLIQSEWVDSDAFGPDS